MMFFSKKYIKRPIVVLISVSLLLQFIPSPQPAEAFDIWGFIENLFAFLKQKIPDEIKLTEKGNIMLGNTCLVGDDSIFGNHCLVNLCICKALGMCPGVGDNDCASPVSNISFGEWKENLFIQEEGPKKGFMDIPVPESIDECRLRIPPPPTGTTFTPEQKLARRKACNYLANIQRSAAQMVYTAKKIFNKTDPLSDCNFIRNCKSQCNLRLGSVTYNISILDIAACLVPGGFMVVVAKVMNVVKIISQIKDAYAVLKTLLADGVSLVNNIFTMTTSASSFFKAFNMLGLNISDVLLAGPMAAGTLWGVGSKALGAASGAVGLEGPEEALKKTGEIVTPDRVERGFNNLKQMLYDFSENLTAFVTAKAQALQMVNQTRQDVEEARQAFKQELPMEFLFRTESQSESKRRLNAMLDDYFTLFQRIDKFLDPAIEAGQIPGRGAGTRETGEISSVKDRTPAQIRNSDTGANYNNLPSSDPLPSDPQWYEDPKVLGFECEKLNETDCKCVFEDRVLPTKLEGLQEKPAWLPPIKTSFQRVYLLRHLLDPDYIKNVVHEALDYDKGTGEYKMKVLNWTKGAWVHYWEDVVRALRGSDYLNEELNHAYGSVGPEERDTKKSWEITHKPKDGWYTMDAAVSIYPPLNLIQALDSDAGGTRAGHTAIEFKTGESDPDKNGETALKEWLEEYKKSRQGINLAFTPGVYFYEDKGGSFDDDYLYETFAPAYGILEPLFIRKTIEDALDGYDMKKLDETKGEWKLLWKNLAAIFRGPEWVEEPDNDFDQWVEAAECQYTSKGECIERFWPLTEFLDEQLNGKEVDEDKVMGVLYNNPSNNYEDSIFLANDMKLTDKIIDSIDLLWAYETQHLRPQIKTECDTEYEASPEGEEKCVLKADENCELSCDTQCQAEPGCKGVERKGNPECPGNPACEPEPECQCETECEASCKQGENYEWWKGDCKETWLEACLARPTKYFQRVGIEVEDSDCEAGHILTVIKDRYYTATLSHLLDSYKDDMMFRNWGDRIEIFHKVSNNLDKIKRAFSYGLSLDAPIFFYTIEDTKAEIDKLKAGNIGPIIDSIKSDLNCDHFQGDYDTCTAEQGQGDFEGQTCVEIYGLCKDEDDEDACNYYDNNCENCYEGYVNYNQCQEDKSRYEQNLDILTAELNGIEIFKNIYEQADQLKNMLKHLRDIWNAVHLTTNRESQIAKYYVGDWIETINQSQTIKGWADNLINAINSGDFTVFLPQEAIDAISGADLPPQGFGDIDYDPAQYIEDELVAQLEGGVDIFRDRVLIPLTDKIGTPLYCDRAKYNDWVAHPEEGYGENGFLEKVSCFELEKDGGENRIHDFFTSLGPYLDALYNLETASDALATTTSHIAALAPKIEIEPVQFNENFVGDWMDRQKDKIEDTITFWKDKKEEQGKAQVFKKSPQSFGDFIANPVKEIDDHFDAINQAIDDSQAGLSLAKEKLENEISWSNWQQLYLDTGDESGAVDTVQEEIMQLKRTIADTSVVNQACASSALVLKTNPNETDEKCQLRADLGGPPGNGLVNPAIRDDDALKSKCDIIKEADAQITYDPAYLADELAATTETLGEVNEIYENDGIEPKCSEYVLADSKHIRDVIHKAMNYNPDTGLYKDNPSTSDDDKLGKNNGPWRVYWEDLAKGLSKNPGWVDQCIAGEDLDLDDSEFPQEVREKFESEHSCSPMKERHKTMKDFCILKLPAIKIVAYIEPESPNFLEETKYIDFYGNPAAEKELSEVLQRYEQIKFGINLAYLSTDQTKKLFDGDHISQAIKDALNCTGTTADRTLNCKMERLNYTKYEWRKYWENIAELLMGPEWVAEKKEDAGDDQEEAHKWMLKMREVFPPLDELKELDGAKITDDPNDDNYFGDKVGSAITNFSNLKPKTPKMECLRLGNEIASMEDKIDFLNELIRIQKEDLGVNNQDELNELLNNCDEQAFQKDLYKECVEFDAVKNAFQDNCSSAIKPEKCQGYKAKIEGLNQFCDDGLLDCSDFDDKIPDLTKAFDETVDEDERIAIRKLRDQIAKTCQDQFIDMRTPLYKVMKVFSIITGIKSATSIFNGVKGSITALKKIVDTARKLKGMIASSADAIKGAVKGEESSSGLGAAAGGLSIVPVKCTASPSISYAGNQVQTGPDGGPVCPNIPALFAQLDSQFSLIRQNARSIDMVQRGIKDIHFQIGKLGINLMEKYEVMDGECWDNKPECLNGDGDCVPSRPGCREPDLKAAVAPVLQRAEALKNKAQLVWALAEAVHFPSQKCTCGSSYCKLPFCVSGLPLTLSPVSNAYCWLTYIFRYPLIKLAQSLAEDLETIPE